MFFARKQDDDLAAALATLRYVRDAHKGDMIAGFLLSEMLDLLADRLTRRETALRAGRGARDPRIGLCHGLRLHVATLQLGRLGSVSPQQRRKDVARLVRRLERDGRRVLSDRSVLLHQQEGAARRDNPDSGRQF